jgi:predicted  nucleic acid-binding Zn-ribbon protein
MLPTGSTGALIIDAPTRAETGRGLQELRARLVALETELRTVRTELVDARQELVVAAEKLRQQGEEIKRIKGLLEQSPAKRPTQEDGGIMRG